MVTGCTFARSDFIFKNPKIIEHVFNKNYNNNNERICKKRSILFCAIHIDYLVNYYLLSIILFSQLIMHFDCFW